MVCLYDESNGTLPIWILLFGVKLGIYVLSLNRVGTCGTWMVYVQ